MGKGSSSPPPAPDPAVTIQAQTAANADTARLGAQLNRVNQVGPTGSITYSQGAAPIDRNKWIDDAVAAERARIEASNASAATAAGGGGNSYDPNTMTPLAGGSAFNPQAFDEAAFRKTFDGRATPTAPGQDQWTQTTTLSPEQQRLYDLQTQGQTTYGETANTLLRNAQGGLSQPVDTDWESYRQKALDAQRARLDPDYARAEEGLRQRLINSGLTAGSEGWQREMDQFQRGRNDALLQADLRAGDTVGQGIQQTAALRGMPLNEASVLLNGGQVQIPQLQNVAQAQVAPTDAMGAYNTQYQGQLAQWQADQQSKNAALGGLFGLAGTLGGAGIRKWG
jgi:hypothetical protein